MRLRARPLIRRIGASALTEWPSATLGAAEYLDHVRGPWRMELPNTTSQPHPSAEYYYHGLFKHTTAVDSPPALQDLLGIRTTGLKLYGDRSIIGDIRGPLQAALSMYTPNKQNGPLVELFRAGYFVGSTLLGSIPGTRHVWLQFFSALREIKAGCDVALQFGGDATNSSTTTRPFVLFSLAPLWVPDPAKLISHPQVTAPFITYEVTATIKSSVLDGSPMLDLKAVTSDVGHGLHHVLRRSMRTVERVSRERSFGSAGELLFALQQPLLDDLMTPALASILDFRSANFYLLGADRGVRWMHGITLNADGSPAEDDKDPVYLPPVPGSPSKYCHSMTSGGEKRFLTSHRQLSVDRWPLIARKLGMQITNIACSGTATDVFAAEKLEGFTKTVDSAGLPWALDVADRFSQSHDCASIDGLVIQSSTDWAAHFDYVDQRPLEVLRLRRLDVREAGPRINLTLPPYKPQKVHLTKSAGQSEASIAVALSVRRAAAESAFEQEVPASARTFCEDMMWLTESAHITMKRVLASMQFDSLAQASKFLSEALLRTLKIFDDAADIVDVLVICKCPADPKENVTCRASWDGDTVATTITNDAPKRPPVANETVTHDRSSQPVIAGRPGSGHATTQSGSEMNSAMLEDGRFLGPLVRNVYTRTIFASKGCLSSTLEDRTGFGSYSLSLQFAGAAYRAVTELADNEIASRVLSSFKRGTGNMPLAHHEIMMGLAENFQGAENITLRLIGSFGSQINLGACELFLRYRPVNTGNLLISALYPSALRSSKPDADYPDTKIQIQLSGQATKDPLGQEHHANVRHSLISAQIRMLDLVTPSLGHFVQREQYQPWADAAALTILNNEWLSPFMRTASVRIAKVHKGVTGKFVGTARAKRYADGRVTLEDEHDIDAKPSITAPSGEESNKQELPDGLGGEGCDQSNLVDSGVGSVLPPHLPLKHYRLTKYPTGEMRFDTKNLMPFPGIATLMPLTLVRFGLAWSRPDQETLSLTTGKIVACVASLLKNTAGSGMPWLCGVASRSLQVFPSVSACYMEFRAKELSADGQRELSFAEIGLRMGMADSQKPRRMTNVTLCFRDGPVSLANGAANFSVDLCGQHETANSLDDRGMADALYSLQKEVHCVSQEMLASADVYSDLSPLTESLAAKLAEHCSSPVMNVIESARVVVQRKLLETPAHVATATHVLMRESQGGVILALGSNVGNRLEALELACNTIDADPAMKIIKTSTLYETEPMYVKDQDRFLNGVCEIETTYQPVELLDRLQDIENRLGRVKVIDKGPRSIDLDILLYRHMHFRNDRLIIPHPLMKEREFVLRPLADIEPGFWFLDKPPASFYLSKVAGQGPPMFPQTPLGPSGEVITAQNPRRKTRVMSILNTTPDSFSDGGLIPVTDRGALRDLIAAQIADGATIIDIGGQSSRPNAPDVTAEEEIRRILPAIEAFNELPEETRSCVAISIDTYRAAVAEAGIKAGAHIVNDISAGTLDADMLSTVARLGCTYVMMHMRGTPASMQDEANTDYEASGGLVESVASELRACIDAAQEAGVRRWRMILDPGIGFAKTQDQNLELLRGMSELVDHPKLRGLPWLVGSSRKGFIGRVTGVTEAKERTWGTAATVAAAVQGGADIVRVHDVKEMVQVVKMADGIYRA